MTAESNDINIQPLDRVDRLSVRTAARLREAIVNGTLPTGSDITIPAIARLFQVSATPVREALIHLAEAGLVTVHSQGIRIASPTPESLMAAFEVREALEGMTANLAAARRTDAEAERILAVATQSAERAQGDDVDTFRAHDSEFHTAVVAAARSEQLERYAHNALDLAQTLRNLRPVHHKFRAASAYRHVETAEAIAAHDSAEAERTMRLHVREVLSHILENYKETYGSNE